MAEMYYEHHHLPPAAWLAVAAAVVPVGAVAQVLPDLLDGRTAIRVYDQTLAFPKDQLKNIRLYVHKREDVCPNLKVGSTLAEAVATPCLPDAIAAASAEGPWGISLGATLQFERAQVPAGFERYDLPTPSRTAMWDDPKWLGATLRWFFNTRPPQWSSGRSLDPEPFNSQPNVFGYQKNAREIINQLGGGTGKKYTSLEVTYKLPSHLRSGASRPLYVWCEWSILGSWERDCAMRLSSEDSFLTMRLSWSYNDFNMGDWVKLDAFARAMADNMRVTREHGSIE